MNWQESLRVAREETERAINRRNAELRRFAADAEAAGREVYARAIRTREKVAAATPAQVRALGVAALQGRLPQVVGEKIVNGAARSAAAIVEAPRKPAAASSPARPKAPTGRRPAPVNLREELRAGVSGAVDEASLGLADHVLAASNAAGEAIQAGNANGFLRDYTDSMAEKRAADAYDASHHGTSRNVGRVVGLAGSVAAMGAPGLARAAFSAAPRGRAAAQVLKYGLRYAPDPRGLTTMMASGGAAAGVVDQVAADLVTGHRSNAADLLGAAGGGAVGGAATRYAGPVLGGGAGGAATSVLTDLANLRDVSLDDALESGRLAAAFGGIGDSFGQRWVRSQGSNEKGKIGDTLSGLKAMARGEDVVRRQARVQLRPEGEPAAHTVADVVSVPRGRPDRPDNWIIGESKLGPHARLTERQEEALQRFADRYVVDFWRYSDIGKMSGGALSPYGGNITDARNDRPSR